MFKIQKIENSKYYIDRAIQDMEKFAQKQKDDISKRFEKNSSTFQKTLEDNNFNKRKDLELLKIRYLNDNINRRLKSIIKSFPNMNKLNNVYVKLINTTENKTEKISDALKRLLWITNQIDEFTQNTEWKIKKTKTQKTVGFLMGKFLGKTNSMFKKNKEFFEILEESRKFMSQLPKFEDLYTIAIAGFPNVGKSTLMKNMTGSDVEIQNYPFTTKGLMFGYIKENNTKMIQLIDTPGLLNRNNKSNGIEQRAELVIAEFCSSVIFVIDFSQRCGFPIEAQFKLLKKTAENQKVIVYLSKTDIFNEEDEELLKEYERKLKKFKVFENSENIKKYIIEEHKKTIPKFDPAKLKTIK